MQPLTSRKLSCGVVVLNDAAELLLCHVTGQDHWDLPKGGAHAGEAPLAAALRETREETGLRLDPATLLDLGRLPFRPRKDLHLFATLLHRFDPADLSCDSHFHCPHGGGARPEMDGYGWFAFSRVSEYCRPPMADILTRRIDLSALLRTLRQPQAIAA